MPERLGPKEALLEFGENPVEFLADALIRGESGENSYTKTVLLVISGIFLVELSLAIRFAEWNTFAVVIGLFDNVPTIAWAIAPLLHRDFGHVAVNVAFIYIAGPVEYRTSKLRYLGLLFFAGYLPVYADGLKLAMFGSKPNVLVIGASGFGFGLLGYALAVQIGTDWQLTPRWWLIVIGGFSGVILVVLNGVLAIWDPISLHLGHLGGLLVGLGFGYRDSQR